MNFRITLSDFADALSDPFESPLAICEDDPLQERDERERPWAIHWWAELPEGPAEALEGINRRIGAPGCLAGHWLGRIMACSIVWPEHFGRSMIAIGMALRKAGIDRPVIVRRTRRMVLGGGCGMEDIVSLGEAEDMVPVIVGRFGHEELRVNRDETAEEAIGRIAGEVTDMAWTKDAVELARRVAVARWLEEEGKKDPEEIPPDIIQRWLEQEDAERAERRSCRLSFGDEDPFA